MGKWVNRKPEAAEIRGICVICLLKPQKKVGGKDKYMAICRKCDNEKYRSEEGKQKDKNRIKERSKQTRRPYREHVKSCCEFCGFIPVHICQLDVDHIDGNHDNNSVDNLQTLCANCHRLKTHLNNDSIK